MKFFVPVLFFLMYLATPFQVSAKVVFANKAGISVEHKIPVKETLGQSFSKSSAELLNLHQQRNSSAQFNYVINRHFINAQQLHGNIMYAKNNFLVAPFLYCKSIGLILIFPEHYFF